MASIPNYDDANAVNRHFDLARALVTAPTQKPLLITPRAVRTIPIAESEIGERMVDDIILGFMDGVSLTSKGFSEPIAQNAMYVAMIVKQW